MTENVAWFIDNSLKFMSANEFNETNLAQIWLYVFIVHLAAAHARHFSEFV